MLSYRTAQLVRDRDLPDISMPYQGEKASSTDSINNAVVETQSWFPMVLELLEDYPWKIPQHQDLVLMPVREDFLMQQGVPQLVAWPISGNPMHHEDFLHRLWISCSHHGGTKPIPTMVPPSLDGLAGINKGVEIPFWDL